MLLLMRYAILSPDSAIAVPRPSLYCGAVLWVVSPSWTHAHTPNVYVSIEIEVIYCTLFNHPVPVLGPLLDERVEMPSAAVEVRLLMQVGEAWRNYSRKVETDPIPTKAITSLFGFMLGDFLAQRIEGRPFNPLRCSTAAHLPHAARDALSTGTAVLDRLSCVTFFYLTVLYLCATSLE